MLWQEKLAAKKSEKAVQCHGEIGLGMSGPRMGEQLKNIIKLMNQGYEALSQLQADALTGARPV